MRKFSVGVNHYWAKTINGRYGGLAQQLVIELFIAIVMGIITIYCYMTPGLGIFFVGFIIPTIIFVLGALFTLYHMGEGVLEKRKNQKEPEDDQSI